MAIRLYRAYSPGTRSRSSLFFDEITTNRPQKALTFGKKACSGRNNRGVITLGDRGGGHKRKYRIISFNRKEANSEVDVITDSSGLDDSVVGNFVITYSATNEHGTSSATRSVDVIINELSLA